LEVANEARETCNCESLNWDTETQGPDAGIIPQSYTVTLVAMDGLYLELLREMQHMHVCLLKFPAAQML